MKTYYENMADISSDELLKGLLAHGLFAEKIPDFLYSESFYDYFISRKKPVFNPDGHDYIRYENIRNVNSLRILSIPNPFAYANLCCFLADKWDDIREFFRTQTESQEHKISRIHIRKLKNSTRLFEMNYKHFEDDGIPIQSLVIKSMFLVEADISNCFPSIYSHSVPWALKGKNTAKQNKNNQQEWYNELDRQLRNIKHYESNGLLIGPHTSNVFSEIILTTIDNKLWNKEYKYIRYIDDYKCYVNSSEQAEKFILDLSSELREFDLVLNTKKTKITPLPQPTNTDWVNQLNSFRLGHKINDGKLVCELKYLKIFMDLAINLSLSNEDNAVFNYAIKMVSSTILGKDAKQYYIDTIHHLVLICPYLVHVIDDCVFKPFVVDSNKIKEIAEDLYDVGKKKNLYEVCSFSVYWALRYKFTLNKTVIDDAINSNDCIFLLLSYINSNYTKNKDEKTRHKNKAKELKNTDFDRYWLYVYEVLPQNDLTDDFKAIKRKKITFIKNEFKY
jgi:hypothetical protein